MKAPIEQNKERIKKLKQLGQDTKQTALFRQHSPFKEFRLVEGSEALGEMRV